MMNRIPVIILILIPVFTGCNQTPDAVGIIEKSIEFHDPGGEWPEYSGEIRLEETRPGSAPRDTKIRFDNARSYFRIERNRTEVHGVEGDSCFVERGESNCERTLAMRNFYTYLWGLPMKLKDPGTQPLEDISEGEINGIPVFKVTVPYEQDTWTFHFARDNYALVAYQFLKNDGSGEYILTDGLVPVGGMRLPDNRTWYDLDSTLLGTDRVVN